MKYRVVEKADGKFEPQMGWLFIWWGFTNGDGIGGVYTVAKDTEKDAWRTCSADAAERKAIKRAKKTVRIYKR